jgi:hypothetical protein
MVPAPSRPVVDLLDDPGTVQPAMQREAGLEAALARGQTREPHPGHAHQPGLHWRVERSGRLMAGSTSKPARQGAGWKGTAIAGKFGLDRISWTTRRWSVSSAICTRPARRPSSTAAARRCSTTPSACSSWSASTPIGSPSGPRPTPCEPARAPGCRQASQPTGSLSRSSFGRPPGRSRRDCARPPRDGRRDR